MRNYILKISLVGTNIWRKISIPKNLNFHDLHDIIQISFGWDDCHSHEYHVGSITFVATSMDDFYVDCDEFYYEDEVPLTLILDNVDKFIYTYDHHNCWTHQIEVLGENEVGIEVPQLIEFGGTMVKEGCTSVEDFMRNTVNNPVNQEEINLILEETYVK